MAIKAVIFDLDNTLYLVPDSVLKEGWEASKKAMLEAGLEKKFIPELDKRIKTMGFSDTVEIIKGKVSGNIIEAGRLAYDSVGIGEIKPFPDTIPTLKKISGKKILVTRGLPERQKKKINTLGIGELFDKIYYQDIRKEEEKPKGYYFELALKDFGLRPDEVIVVGDKVSSEIKWGNKLGMITVQILKGKHSSAKPEGPEIPDYRIDNLSEVIDIIELHSNLKIVAIGGGTGLPLILEGLKKYTDNITAIVTVTDSGRSSGIIREEMNVLPPGDIRNCLIALSESEKLLQDLFKYRFDNGTLKGHSFGNLLIAALTKLTGSFERSIRETSKILNLKGKVLPSTLQNVHICAELEDGRIVEKELNVRMPGKKGIKKVFLKPRAETTGEVIDVIMNADIIILGPGSLFTSIISNLLVSGISEALRDSKAKKVFICNIATQPGQTDGYKASDHVKKILEYIDRLDFVILNNKKPEDDVLKKYWAEKSFLVENDTNEIERLGVKTILADVIDESKEKELLWEKQYLLRHDPAKIAKVILSVLKK